MFQYCPSCASKKIQFKGNKFSCPDCGFVYYHNTAAATGCIIESGGKILFLIRAKEPALGKLDLPGGFVDPGEGLLEGLYRELKEELGWAPPIAPDIPLADSFKLVSSFPNIYPYKNIVYNTCDIFFAVTVPALNEKDLHIEAGEISGVCFLSPGEIKNEDIAFSSTWLAINVYLNRD